MKLLINGEQKLIPILEKNASLRAVIEHLNLNPKLIVVEFNGEIINSHNWAEQQVKEGDILEIVTIVGGGWLNQKMKSIHK